MVLSPKGPAGFRPVSTPNPDTGWKPMLMLQCSPAGQAIYGFSLSSVVYQLHPRLLVSVLAARTEVVLDLGALEINVVAPANKM
jgi:hypothetical protein